MTGSPHFGALSSRAVILELANVDTDQIIPARFLKRPREEGFQSFLFHALRRHPDGSLREDFPLNAQRAAGAQILISGANFGCGSAREGAVYALLDSGFRAVLAPSFGDIFAGNALQNGLLPVALALAELDMLGRTLAADPEQLLCIDLTRLEVSCAGLSWAFDVDPFMRELLLSGSDEVSLTLAELPRIEAFEARRAAQRPWTGAPRGSRPAPRHS